MRRNPIFILFAVAVYSTSGYFSKSASFHEFLSLPYLCFFAGIIIVLGVYAILWQGILKVVPLNLAYLYKASGLVFSLMIAHFAFQENISLQNMIGCGIVLSGITAITIFK